MTSKAAKGSGLALRLKDGRLPKWQDHCESSFPEGRTTSLGDGREDIYFLDNDRRAWLELVGKVCERFNWEGHAYCQMANYYHIVVETPEANLAQGMRQLNGVYTQYVNRTHGRVGRVFSGAL